MTEAIVHVGVHKTGTSSIQRVLSRHRPELLTQGFLYPRFSPNHYDINTAFRDDPLNYHMVRGRGLKTEEEVEELRARVLGSIQDEVQSTQAPKLLICSEDISSLDAPALMRFRDWLDSIGVVKKTMIIYVRDHISFWESQVQQHVKGGAVLDIEQETRVLHKVRLYRPYVEALDEVFGHDNVRVNVFSPSRLIGGDVILDFAAKIGLDVTGMEMLRANESLSRDAMLFLNEMNRRIDTYGEHGKSLLRDGLLESLRTFKGAKFKADLPTCERIFEKSAGDRQYLARNWFGGDDTLGVIMQQAIAKVQASQIAEERGEHDAEAPFEVAAHLYRRLKEENLKLSADRFRLKSVLKRNAGDAERAKEFMDKSKKFRRELGVLERDE